MNKQEKIKNGKVTGRGIQWTDYTQNPVGGCRLCAIALYGDGAWQTRSAYW